MLLKLLLLGICLALVLLFTEVLIPKITLKIRLYKELKEKRKRQKQFGKKMKELEIK